MKQGLSLVKVWVLALALAVCVAAQEYSFRFYGAAEGLQNLVVLSLAQDRAGYIWAGTEAGLYRYESISGDACWSFSSISPRRQFLVGAAPPAARRPGG